MKAPREGLTSYRIYLTAYGFWGVYAGQGFEKGSPDPVEFPDLAGAIAVARIWAVVVAGDRRYFGHRSVGIIRVQHLPEATTFKEVFSYEIAEGSEEILTSDDVETVLAAEV